jgi:hypothetical protein
MRRFELGIVAVRASQVHAKCTHEGSHSPEGRYDRECHEIRYVTTCDGCGAETGEVYREPYSPNFDPSGNDAYLAAAV